MLVFLKLAADFSRWCAGYRIGHLLFPTHPYRLAIRKCRVLICHSLGTIMIPYPTVILYKDASQWGQEVSAALSDIVSDFAVAFKAVDETRPQEASRKRTYRPGIGPLQKQTL
jgi:hypothetical protein